MNCSVGTRVGVVVEMMNMDAEATDRGNYLRALISSVLCMGASTLSPLVVTMEVEDRLVSDMPIHYTNALQPNIQLHQFPLLTRPLEVPPSAVASGKRIRARVKSKVKRIEVHLPVDTRPEVWNSERSKDLGVARGEDDKEKNQELPKLKQREGEEARLSEVRMRSEQVPQVGVYVLGVLREGESSIC